MHIDRNDEHSRGEFPTPPLIEQMSNYSLVVERLKVQIQTDLGR